MDIEPAFKKKSDNNLLAAQLLIQGENCTLKENKISLANESVHCSYYAVLQYIKYFLMEKTTTTAEQLEKDAAGERSHEKLINLLEMATSGKLSNKFDGTLKSLKTKRTEADYKLKIFDKEAAEECLKTAHKLISDISKFL